MSDEDLVTLRIKHELDGVVYAETMSRAKAFWRTTFYTKNGQVPKFCDIGDQMLSAKDGGYVFVIASGVEQ